MACPPVRGDNPRALTSGLSYVQVDKRGITTFTTCVSVNLAHHEIFLAKVGKIGISNSYTMGCAAVHEDNPRALAYIQVDRHTTYISVDLAHYEIFHANVGIQGWYNIQLLTSMT